MSDNVGGIDINLAINLNRVQSEAQEAKRVIDNIASVGGGKRVIDFNIKLNKVPNATDLQTFINNVNDAVQKGIAKGVIKVEPQLDLPKDAWHGQVMAAIGAIDVPIKWHWEDGHGPGPGGPGGAPGPDRAPGPQTPAGGRGSRRRAQAEEGEAAATERSARVATQNVQQGVPAHETRAQRRERLRIETAERRIATAKETLARAQERLARVAAAPTAAPAAAPVTPRAPSVTPAKAKEVERLRSTPPAQHPLMAALKANPTGPAAAGIVAGIAHDTGRSEAEVLAAATGAKPRKGTAGARQAALTPAVTPTPVVTPAVEVPGQYPEPPTQFAACPSCGATFSTPQYPNPERSLKAHDNSVHAKQRKAAAMAATPGTKAQKAEAARAAAEGRARGTSPAIHPPRLATPAVTATPGRDVVSIDTLRGGSAPQYTDAERVIHQLEALKPVEHVPSRTRHRRSGTAGINVPAEEGAGVRGGSLAAGVGMSPQEIERRDMIRKFLEPGFIKQQEQAQTDVYASEGDTEFRDALRTAGWGDWSALERLDPASAEAMQAFLRGELPAAGTAAREALDYARLSEKKSERKGQGRALGTMGKNSPMAMRLDVQSGEMVPAVNAGDLFRSALFPAMANYINRTKNWNAAIRKSAGPRKKGSGNLGTGPRAGLVAAAAIPERKPTKNRPGASIGQILLEQQQKELSEEETPSPASAVPFMEIVAPEPKLTAADLRPVSAPAPLPADVPLGSFAADVAEAGRLKQERDADAEASRIAHEQAKTLLPIGETYGGKEGYFGPGIPRAIRQRQNWEKVPEHIRKNPPTEPGLIAALAARYGLNPDPKEWGKAKGGSVGSLSDIEKLASKGSLYARWTPDLAADMRPGARSAGLMDRTAFEAGISAKRVVAGKAHEGINAEYDMFGHGFAPRELHLLRGREVGEGWDGEPLLDPESIRHVAHVPRNVVSESLLKSGYPDWYASDAYKALRAKYGKEKGGPVERLLAGEAGPRLGKMLGHDPWRLEQETDILSMFDPREPGWSPRGASRHSKPSEWSTERVIRQLEQVGRHRARGGKIGRPSDRLLKPELMRGPQGGMHVSRRVQQMVEDEIFDNRRPIPVERKFILNFHPDLRFRAPRGGEYEGQPHLPEELHEDLRSRNIDRIGQHYTDRQRWYGQHPWGHPGREAGLARLAQDFVGSDVKEFDPLGFYYRHGGDQPRPKPHATGGWVERMMAGLIKPVDYTAQVRGPGADLNPESWLVKTGKRRGFTYLVGEKGTEEYFPEHESWRIPRRVMAQLPKRAEGGEVLGAHGPEVRTFDEPGWVVPHHLLGQMATGGYVEGGLPPRVRMRVGGRFVKQATQRGDVQAEGLIARVYVVNWPTGFGAVGGANAGGPTGSVAQQPAMPLPGTGPTPSGQPGTTPTVPRLGRISPADVQRARIAALDEMDEDFQNLQEIRTKITGALQMDPMRAFVTSMGQIMQVAVGGREGIQKRAREAARLASVHAADLAQEKSARQKLGEATKALDNVLGTPGVTPEKIAAAEGVVRGQAEAFDVAQTQKGISRVAAEKAAGGIITPIQAIRGQAVGAITMVGASMAFSTAMAVAQMGLEKLGEALGPAVDRMMGFAQTAARVTDSMAEQIQKGGTGGVAGFAGAIAGMGFAGPTAESLSLTQQRASLEAGAKQMQQQVDMIRTEWNLQGRDKLDQTGFGGFGNGPLAGTSFSWMNQTPGAMEMLSGLVKGTSQEKWVPETNTTTPVPPTQMIPLDTVLGGGIPYVGQEPGPISPYVQPMPGVGDVKATEGHTEWVIDAEKTENAATYFNEQITKGTNYMVRATGKSFDNYAKVITHATTAQIDAMNAALKGTTAEGYGTTLAHAGMAFVSSEGKTLTSDQLQGAISASMQAALQGSNLATPTEMLKSMGPQLQAQQRQMIRDMHLQQEQLIPAQFAMQLAAHPLPSTAGQGVVPSGTAGLVGLGAAGEAFSNVDQATSSFGELGPSIAAVRKEISALGADGEAKMRALATAAGVPGAEFDKLLANVKSTANAIRAINEEEQNLQQGQALSQYNVQLFRAKRSLGDIVGLAKAGSVNVGLMTKINKDGTAEYKNQVIAATELGKLNRQQWDIGRQSQAIQLAMSQRELNLQVAMAHLMTPGSTPEERATAAREAEAQAKSQQQLLTNQFKQYNIEGQVFTITVDRQLHDAITDLKAMTSGEAITLRIQGLESLKALDTALLDNQTAMLDTTTAAGVQWAKLASDVQAQIEAASGQFEDSFAKEVAATFATIASNIPTLPGTPSSEGNTGFGGHTPETIPTNPANPLPSQGETTDGTWTRNASGIIFRTQGATKMVVGEAGSETVAVLRNVREFSPGMTRDEQPGGLRILDDTIRGLKQMYSPPPGGMPGGMQKWEPSHTQNPDAWKMVSPGMDYWKGSHPMIPAGGMTQWSPTPTSGGGGGGNVQVIFNNAVVRSDDDLDAIVRKVEQVFNRRTLEMGLMRG